MEPKDKDPEIENRPSTNSSDTETETKSSGETLDNVTVIEANDNCETSEVKTEPNMDDSPKPASEPNEEIILDNGPDNQLICCEQNISDSSPEQENLSHDTGQELDLSDVEPETKSPLPASISTESLSIDTVASVTDTLYPDTDLNNNMLPSGDDFLCNTGNTDPSDYNQTWTKTSVATNVVSVPRTLSTPDDELQDISPELFCLSPTDLYDKEFGIGAPRPFTRQHPHTATASSTLNTPDPIFYEDTDSNISNHPELGNYQQELMEDPVSGYYNNQNMLKGEKRKFVPDPSQCNNNPNLQFSSSLNMINAGRPPDISTWTAVNPSRHIQPEYLQQEDIQYKPTCTVPPYLRPNVSHTMPTINHTSNQMFTSNPTTNLNYINNNFYPLGGYNNYTEGYSGMLPSCQFAQNQANFAAANYGNIHMNPEHLNSRSAAAYRLDFPSPMPMYTAGESPVINVPTIPTFVSHNPYLPQNITRPQAVLPQNYVRNYGNYGYSANYGVNNMNSRPSVSQMQYNFVNNNSDYRIPYDPNMNNSNTMPRVEPVETANTDREETDNNDNVVIKEEEAICWSSKGVSVPLTARQKKMMCPIKDLSKKTLKQLIATAEKVETVTSDSSGVMSPSQSVKKIQNKNFEEKFLKERESKSPISAFCAVLDLSKHKRRTSEAPTAEPQVPTTAYLAQNNANFMYNGSLFFPFTNPAGAIPAIRPSISTAQMGNEPRIQLNNISLPQYAEHLKDLRTTTSGHISDNDSSTTSNDNTLTAFKVTLGGSGSTTSISTSGAATDKMPVLGSRRRRTSTPANTSSTLVPAYGRTTSHMVTVATASYSGQQIAASPVQNDPLTTFYPVPDSVYRHMYTSSYPKAKLKARHYNFNLLQIGSFKYTCDMRDLEKTARVKFFFSKKKMVYEFQLNNGDLHKELTEIEIPFKNIVNLWLYDKEMRIEIDGVPRMFLGVRGMDRTRKFGMPHSAIYNRKAEVDLTNGQLTTVPYHYVHFKQSCTDKIKADLRQFDSRFVGMLNLPLVVDARKSLTPVVQPVMSYLLDPAVQYPTPGDHNNNVIAALYKPTEDQTQAAIGEHSVGNMIGEHRTETLICCSCTEGCSSSDCQCCVQGRTCTEGPCTCINCHNPLNILHQLGLPAARARTDPCLMENIYQIKQLDYYVKTQLTLDCCKIQVLLFNCIPGEIMCTNPNCNTTYKFSWCNAVLCNEAVSPRNHCVKCASCSDFRQTHCQNCNTCYFAGVSGTFKCPTCHNETVTDQIVLDSSTDSED